MNVNEKRHDRILMDHPKTRRKKEETLQRLMKNLQRHRENICDHRDYQGFPTIQYHQPDLTDNDRVTMGRCTKCGLIIPISRLPRKYEDEIEKMHPGFDHIPYRRMDGTFTCMICNHQLDEKYMEYFGNRLRVFPIIAEFTKLTRMIEDVRELFNLKPERVVFDDARRNNYKKNPGNTSRDS